MPAQEERKARARAIAHDETPVLSCDSEGHSPVCDRMVDTMLGFADREFERIGLATPTPSGAHLTLNESGGLNWVENCEKCGASFDGEWFDGSELTCGGCGVQVIATCWDAGKNGNVWHFPVVESEEDE